MAVLLKVSAGYFSTSKKSAERRCASRSRSLVSMLDGRIVTTAEDSSGCYSS